MEEIFICRYFLELTSLNPEVAEDISGRIYVSKISPKSGSLGPKPKDEYDLDMNPNACTKQPTRLHIEAVINSIENLVKSAVEMIPAESHNL